MRHSHISLHTAGTNSHSVGRSQKLTGFNTKYKCDRVHHQRLQLEEYDADIRYIEGPKNVVADALSRLDIDKRTKEEFNLFEDEPFPPFHLDRIKEVQATDPMLLNMDNNNKSFKQEEGVWKYISPRARNKDEWKIYIPTKLKAELIEWYHDVLKYPGTTRMINTINKNFGWPGLISDIKKFVKNCDKCQRYKLTARKNMVKSQWTIGRE